MIVYNILQNLFVCQNFTKLYISGRSSSGVHKTSSSWHNFGDGAARFLRLSMALPYHKHSKELPQNDRPNFTFIPTNTKSKLQCPQILQNPDRSCSSHMLIRRNRHVVSGRHIDGVAISNQLVNSCDVTKHKL